MLGHVIGPAVAAVLLQVVLLLAVAGCGPVPQPFSKDEANLGKAPFLIAPTTEGVVVLPVEGVDRETGRLIAGLAAAPLQKQEIAASVEARKRPSLIPGRKRVGEG